MRALIIQLALLLCSWVPAIAEADPVVRKDPLSYPLKQYAFVLALALLGGLVSWYSKVRKGQLAMSNLMALVGELTTSALSGLLAFYACEWLDLSPLLTACIVGVAGHMGTRAINWAEETIKRRADHLLGNGRGGGMGGP